MHHRRACRPLLAGSALVALLCGAAHGATHALIMTIGEYKAPGAAPLKGVARDAANAREIARRLGAKDSDMTFLRDGQLTYQGMSAAFDALNERIRANDQVFIYFSGHGGRQLVSDPEQRCAESLVTVDGDGFIDTELEIRLKTLSRKAGKLIVFLDACHSGGVTTRAARDARFAPKYYAMSGAEACTTPVNVLKRNLGLATRSAGSGAQNYVFVAAARDNEVSLDEPGKGGVATQAWLECMSGAARDLDGSGAVTAEEVRVCAQQRVEAKVLNIAGFLPHHISITGNAGTVLSFASALVTAAPAATTPAAAAPPQTPVSPENTLRDIFSNRDDRRVVTLAASQPTHKIGRDAVQLTLTSSHAGHVYLLMAGSDRKSFDMLFPNRLDRSNLIGAGESMKLPRLNWQIRAGGPPGRSQVLVVVADAPRDFTRLKMSAAGPFSILEANSVSAKDIQLVTVSSANAASAECNDPIALRNLQVAQNCSDAYGAALLAVEETE